MNLIPGVHRYRLHLVQVGLAGTVSAVATHLDGALRGSTWTITCDTPLPEFLARPNYEIPAGTPLIRLDLTGDDVYFARVAGGPGWDPDQRPGYVQPPLGTSRRHDGEPWTAMPGWSVSSDVYAVLAPTAGVVVESAADHVAGTAIRVLPVDSAVASAPSVGEQGDHGVVVVDTEQERLDRPAHATDSPVQAVSRLRDLLAWFDGDGEMRYCDSVEDGRHDNSRRAGFAALAVLSYAVRTGLLNDRNDEEPATAIGDLLGDLRHLADSLGLDYTELDRRGKSHYVPELRGEF